MMFEELRGKRVALVGGCGFIGHHLALKLHRLGARVDVVDSLQVNHLGAFAASADAIPNRSLLLHLLYERLHLLREADIPLHIQDARDYQVFARLMGELKPDVIIHLAAVAHASIANKDPFTTFDHSLRTLENSLDCARDRVERFVYFSSSMVYGNFDGAEVTEESACEPIGIYGALKYSGEKMVIAYNQVFDMPYTIVRPSALYGERCVSRRVGQVFIENVLRGLDIEVRGDGEDRLDFTYIEDLAQGILRILTHEEAANQIFNLTYGSSRSVAQLIDVLKEHFPDVKVNHKPRERLMPQRGTLSVDKARRLLGYQPAYPLEEGFVRYIEWYKELVESHQDLFES